MERPAIVSGVDNDTGEDIVGGSEHCLTLLFRRLNRQIVAVVEVGANIGNPVERSRSRLAQCENIVGLVRQIPLRHGVADNRAIVAAKQTVERRPHPVRAGEGKLLDREVERRTNRIEDFIGHDKFPLVDCRGEVPSADIG